jgi:hypothetical protein
LISSSNVDNILEKCYNYLVKTKKTNAKIIEGTNTTYGERVNYGEKKYGSFKYGQRKKVFEVDKPVNVGDVIEIATEYLGYVKGFVSSQNFNLNGGIIIKDSEVEEI